MTRILLVEDDRAGQKLVALLLTQAGHAVTTCATMASALATLSLDQFGGVVVDLGLPDGRGIDLIAHVRKDERMHGIPVVVITASTSASDHAAAMAAGCTVFIRKPLDTRGFAGAIDRAFRSPLRA